MQREKLKWTQVRLADDELCSQTSHLTIPVLKGYKKQIILNTPQYALDNIQLKFSTHNFKRAFSFTWSSTLIETDNTNVDMNEERSETNSESVLLGIVIHLCFPAAVNTCCELHWKREWKSSSAPKRWWKKGEPPASVHHQSIQWTWEFIQANSPAAQAQLVVITGICSP